MIIYKTDRQRKELMGEKAVRTGDAVYKVNPMTVKLLYWLNEWAEKNMSIKVLIVTDVLRTQEEQDKIYHHLIIYKQKPWKSVHQFGRGIDIAVSNLMEAGLDPDLIVEAVNANWIYDPSRPKKKCAVRHNVGRGDHIHLQVHPNTNIVQNSKFKINKKEV